MVASLGHVLVREAAALPSDSFDMAVAVATSVLKHPLVVALVDLVVKALPQLELPWLCNNRADGVSGDVGTLHAFGFYVYGSPVCWCLE